ncbi:hypothetical protein ACFY13_37340 [Streptomyces mirabilis]|uniref:hypothetical protein n=1 Tax=Streptomyces mirabilis TaxID=68239 RepID=UPI0036A8939A
MPRVRRAAAIDPLLPRTMISTLLNGPGLAEGTAANPSLPPEQLHELLGLGGLLRAAAQ